MLLRAGLVDVVFQRCSHTCRNWLKVRNVDIQWSVIISSIVTRLLLATREVRKWLKIHRDLNLSYIDQRKHSSTRPPRPRTCKTKMRCQSIPINRPGQILAQTNAAPNPFSSPPLPRWGLYSDIPTNVTGGLQENIVLNKQGNSTEASKN